MIDRLVGRCIADRRDPSTEGRRVLALLLDVNDGHRQTAHYSRDVGDGLQRDRPNKQERVGSRVRCTGRRGEREREPRSAATRLSWSELVDSGWRPREDTHNIAVREIQPYTDQFDKQLGHA